MKWGGRCPQFLDLWNLLILEGLSMLHSSILLEKLTDLERRLQILPLGSQEEALVCLWWPGFGLSIRISNLWNEMGGVAPKFLDVWNLLVLEDLSILRNRVVLPKGVLLGSLLQMLPPRPSRRRRRGHGFAVVDL